MRMIKGNILNGIKSVTLEKCTEQDKPIPGLNVGDFYLKITDSLQSIYCSLAALKEHEEE